MTDKARDLLKRCLRRFYKSGYECSQLVEDIENYLAEPENKREPLNEETIRWEYEKTEKNLGVVMPTEYGWFDLGVRFAEKHHGIGGEDE